MKTYKNNIYKLLLVSALTAGLALMLPGRAAAQYRTAITKFTGDVGAAPGANPYGSLTSSGRTLYGTTCYGGSSSWGTVFKVNTDGSGYTVLKNYAIASDGSTPFSSLTVSGSTLYGTTSAGGSGNAGTVFKMNTDGTGYTVLRNFAFANDGRQPYAGVTISGNTLYGTTYYGGSVSFRGGTVFKVNTDGSGYTVLKSFDYYNEGGNIQGGLVLSGNTLYGTAAYGGSAYGGTVFKVNTDGSDFTVLKTFNRTTDGGDLYAGLTLVGSTLYGTAANGGSSNKGTVFKMNTDGSGFTVLHNFTGNNDGAFPQASLTLIGSTLYGTTVDDSSTVPGTVFKINTDGTGYAVLSRFNGGSDSYGSYAGLTLVSNVLYGTTTAGGTSGNGTIFKVSYSVVEKNGLVPSSPAGAVYSKFGVAAVNSSNQVTFKATLSTGPGGVVSSNSIAIYAGMPGAEVLQARIGTAAPDTNGTPTAAYFSALSDPVINNAGEVAFLGTLQVGGSVTVDNDTGIWSTAGGTLHRVAREGDTDSATGGTFAKFTSFALPDTGDVVFLGVLKGTTAIPGPGSPAVVSTNNTGIWACDSEGALQKVMRTSDQVLTKVISKISFLPAVSYSPGQTRSVTTQGDKIVYNAVFTDGSTAILQTDLP